MIYSKVAYHILPLATFYDALAPLIDISYTVVDHIWLGVTNDQPLEQNDVNPPLDHRWHNVFLHTNYYVWTGKAHRYYNQVRHLIEPHPENWSVDDWQKDLQRKKKTGIIVPR